MATVPTREVLVDWHEGPIIINASDFDLSVHRAVESELAYAELGTESDLTRAGVAAMGKADVRQLLEAHGVDVPKGATVDKMRQMLTDVLFVDL